MQITKFLVCVALLSQFCFSQNWENSLTLTSIVFKDNSIYRSVIGQVINKGSSYLKYVEPEIAFFKIGKLSSVEEGYLSSCYYGQLGLGLAPGDTGYFEMMDEPAPYDTFYINFRTQTDSFPSKYQYDPTVISVSGTTILNRNYFSCQIKNTSSHELKFVYVHLLLYRFFCNCSGYPC